MRERSGVRECSGVATSGVATQGLRIKREFSQLFRKSVPGENRTRGAPF